MNKKVIAVIVLLLLGIGGYFGYTKFMAGKTPGSASENSGGSKSLKDLLSAGVAQQCTYSTVTGSTTSEGTTYVSGGKVRADFSTTTSGKVVKSHMISDGKTSYIWTDGEKSGFKMTVSESTSTDTKTASSDSSVSSGTDLSQKADYKCSTWIVDSSVFTPPSNITFTDFSQMFATPVPGAGGSGSSSQCAYCAGLSGDDKAQCLSAFKCN